MESRYRRPRDCDRKNLQSRGFRQPESRTHAHEASLTKRSFRSMQTVRTPSSSLLEPPSRRRLEASQFLCFSQRGADKPGIRLGNRSRRRRHRETNPNLREAIQPGEGEFQRRCGQGFPWPAGCRLPRRSFRTICEATDLATKNPSSTGTAFPSCLMLSVHEP